MTERPVLTSGGYQGKHLHYVTVVAIFNRMNNEKRDQSKEVAVGIVLYVFHFNELQ